MVAYGVEEDTGCINYEKLREIALQEKPKMIVAGASAYARAMDVKEIGEIANEIDAYSL